MTLVKADPWRDIEDIFGQFSKYLSLPRLGGQDLLASGDWAPKVDITEDKKEYLIKAELPEVKKEDVTVTVDNGVLTLRGERRHEKEEKDKRIHRVERSYGSFARSFTLPDNVDESDIKASYRDGMLNLRIRKTEKSKPEMIEVKVD